MYEPIYYYNKELIKPVCNLFEPLKEKDHRRVKGIKEEILAPIISINARKWGPVLRKINNNMDNYSHLDSHLTEKMG